MHHAVRLISVSLAAFVAASVHSADWKPADGPLTTPWTKDVSPQHALPEYPRPQMVREGWQNLNGLWKYATQAKDNKELPKAWQGEILVPFPIESVLSGVKKTVSPDERLWYRRTFQRPKMADDGRLLLHFGAVDWQCTVWVNGKQVGEHAGGYDPFTFDVTDAARDGENELVVAVFDPTDAGTQPRGKQVRQPRGIWYTSVTGIWQIVWLEAVPHDYINSLKIVPDIDRGVTHITVNASKDGQKVRVAARDGATTVASAEGEAGTPLELAIKDARLWSPDSPHLYDLDIELLQDGKAADSVKSYLGMRKIAVAKDANGVNRLMLNNKPIFQYGPLDQGWWPDGLYTAPTDEALKYDIEMTKKFGMNMARKHVKVEPDRWYYWCDKLGLLVWQDMPSGDFQRDEAGRESYRRELQAMIDARENHPSVVMWVPFNEGWGQHNTESVVDWVKKYDPSRPVNEASGWNDRGSGDVSDIHDYPGVAMRPIEAKRVVVLGEFGGLGMPVSKHTWQDEKNWGYVSYKSRGELTDAYVNLLTAMRPLIGQGLSAAVYTQTSDVEIEVNGLMTYDRQVVKMDLDRIAAAAKKLYGPPPTVATLVPTSEEDAQQWRYATAKPVDDWTEPKFDDTPWKSGPGGFGGKGTPGARLGTPWQSSDIWLRRTFALKEPPRGDLFLRIHHDDEAEVYVNGQRVATQPGHRRAYGLAPLEPGAAKHLHTGENTLAVHCHQNGGGQYIDVGIVELTEPAGPSTEPEAAAASR
jgi:hypothetical protein